MASKKLFAFFIIISVTTSDALRILLLFLGPTKSHGILGTAAANHLLAAGHEVVYITTFPLSKPHANLTEISLNHVVEKFQAPLEKSESFKLKNQVGKESKSKSAFVAYFSYQLHKLILEDNVFIKYLKNPNEKFDVVLLEWFFSEVTAGIAPVFECPLIWLGSSEADWQMLKIVDDIPNPAYNVDITSYNRPPLNFLQRVEELWILTKKKVVYRFIEFLENSLYNRIFGEIAEAKGINLPPYREAKYNGSLLLINSHPSTGSAFRLPQSAKYIGGFHIETVLKPLQKDFQNLMDEAKHGVIYFSLGSNVNSADMSDNLRDSLLQIFSELKQIVIWKFEAEIPNVPKNVHLVKWASQQSILSHPNLRIFITHGGQLSTIEAVHFGVPVIGIPIAADQHVNMKSVTDKGFGISIGLTEELPKHLNTAIREMLHNKTYTDMAKQFSMIYHDRQKPGEELVYWVEHVVKTGGAPHLRSPALHLFFFQKMYLDLAAVVIPVLVALSTILKTLYRRCKNRSLSKNKTE